MRGGRSAGRGRPVRARLSLMCDVFLCRGTGCSLNRNCRSSRPWVSKPSCVLVANKDEVYLCSVKCKCRNSRSRHVSADGGGCTPHCSLLQDEEITARALTGCNSMPQYLCRGINGNYSIRSTQLALRVPMSRYVPFVGQESGSFC